MKKKSYEIFQNGNDFLKKVVTKILNVANACENNAGNSKFWCEKAKEKRVFLSLFARLFVPLPPL